MDQPVHKKDKPKVNVGFGIGVGEYTASVVVGVVSGILTAAKTIRDKFYDDVKNSIDFKDYSKNNAQDLEKIKFNGNSKDRKAFEDFAAEIQKKKKEFASNFDKFIIEKRGVRTSLVGGTFDRAALMGRKSVNSIVLRSIVGIGVGAAMTLSFFNGIATRDKIERIDNAVEPQLDEIKSATERTTRHVDRLAEAEARHNKKKADAAAAGAAR